MYGQKDTHVPHPQNVNTDQATTPDFVGLEQNDPQLLKYIRKMILPPSSLPYNFSKPFNIDYSQFKQSRFADMTFLRKMVSFTSLASRLRNPQRP